MGCVQISLDANALDTNSAPTWASRLCRARSRYWRVSSKIRCRPISASARCAKLYGLVGAGGLGCLIQEQLSSFDYRGVLASLIALLVLTFVVDAISALARRAVPNYLSICTIIRRNDQC